MKGPWYWTGTGDDANTKREMERYIGDVLTGQMEDSGMLFVVSPDGRAYKGEVSVKLIRDPDLDEQAAEIEASGYWHDI